MTILDTLPELPKAKLRTDAGWTDLYTADQLRERDRIVVEHVVRMCADRAKSRLTGIGAEAAILALLEPKP